MDDIVTAQLASQQIPGAAVVVLKAGKIVKVGAYGLADRELNVPATTDTVFRLQSASKSFTAMGVMLLVEEGKIRLDDPISVYLDGCPMSWRKISVRHLLGQTSGLRDFVNESESLDLDLGKEATDEQMMASVARQSLKFEPGETWDYSNTNYLLLSMIIRRASGRWYGDFLAERIFQPLGMTRTSVPRDRASLSARAKGYTLENGRLQLSAADTGLATSVLSYGGGGIQSTVLDLAKWDAALYTEQLLKRATLEQMWTPVTLNNGTAHPYGFGWQIGAIGQHRRIWHGGDWTGFAANVDRFVDDELTVMVLTNRAGSSPARISLAVAGAFNPALAAPVYKPIADREPAVTARFVDVLRRGSDGRLRADEFTAPIWNYISPNVEQMKRDFTSLGAIQELVLVERTESGGERSYRYRARFSGTTLIFHFILTKEDLISVMMPELVGQ